MSEPKQAAKGLSFSNNSIGGLAALSSYNSILDFMGESGRGQQNPSLAPPELPFIQKVPGLKQLFLSMSAVAPATPDTRDEEWNPISQRPHSALNPVVTNEFGGEITALKVAIDDFTILSHEMMHVALWEPLFAGHWRPRGRRSFREFSLMAEGFCYFFSDIVVSGAVRVRLPDGEFALDRQTPSNARFHPIRAFQSLGIHDHHDILDTYLEGFSGQRTRLWQPRGTSDFAASLAAQAYHFYAGSQRYLDDMHAALTAFGGLAEFYQRFCAIPGLPTFLTEAQAKKVSADLKSYFSEFFRGALPNLAKLPLTQVLSIRYRRMLQMRAYYGLQVRWLLSQNLIVARTLSAAIRAKIITELNSYLDGLETLLHQLANQANQSNDSLLSTLTKLDLRYDRQVRSKFRTHDAWSGQRWLIAPRRAGGCIGTSRPCPEDDRAAKKHVSQTVAFLVEELTARMVECKTVSARSEFLMQIKRLAELGSAGGVGSAARTQATFRKLRMELAKSYLLPIWSVPMASFDPLKNRYRELVFSYQ